MLFETKTVCSKPERELEQKFAKQKKNPTQRENDKSKTIDKI